MMPNKLKLTNFIGIRDALGRDELELDFDALVGDAALVALKGPNGCAKSTVLDNLHPYRIMPSRAGSYSPKSFSYYDETFGDAEKRLEWSHDEVRYRSVIVIKGTNKSKTTHAFLQQLDIFDAGTGNETGWAPVKLPDGTSSDGKGGTYDACLEHILGSAEMFFTAVFASQNRVPLSAYKNAEIKGLLSELLGLDHILEHGKQASEVVKGLNARLNGFNQTLSQAERLPQDRETAEDSRASVGATVTMKQAARLQADSTVSELTQELAIQQANAGSTASIDKQKREINEALQASQYAYQTRSQELRASMDRERDGLRQYGDEYEAAAANIQRRLDAAGQRLNGYQALLHDAVAITAAASDVVELIDTEARTAAELATLRTQDQARAEKMETRADVRVRFEELKASGQRLASELEGARKRAKLAAEVPCAGTKLQDVCQLLGNARTAADLIPSLELALEDKRAECETCRTEETALTADVEAFGDLTALINARATQRLEIRRDLDRAQALANQAPALEQAQTEANRAKREAAELDQAKAAAVELEQVKTSEFCTRIDQLDKQIVTLQEDNQQKTMALQQQLVELEGSDTAALVKEAEDDLQTAKQTRRDIGEALTTKQAEMARLDAQIETIDQAIADAETTRTQAEAIETELSTWRLLAAALGNDGIVALSIDDAGPTLASITNALLLAAYGPRFTVAIETQTQTQAGTDKETFDIIVFDADRDQKKSIRKMSGGERIWINECLTRAIALYQAQQSGRQYDCLFADESDGALDKERKEMFVKMKRKVMELGGYKREFFITHTPELWDLADAVIDMQELRA